MSKSDSNTISFRALQLANEHRNAYGLRYNDFARYRKHCGNRTHRLRSSLKMTHGKGKDFKKLPPVTLEYIKAGHLELLLFETERAWAYAQELYTASLQPAYKERASKLRHTATGRFRRALHWCTQLLSHCQTLYAAQHLSAGNVLEVNAYILILSGRFLRYKDEYEDALHQLSVASSILSLLEECAESSKDQALACVFKDEIAPEIRYCAHQMGRENAYDIDEIVKEVAPKHQDQLVEGYATLAQKIKTEGRADASAKGRKRLQELKWEGEPVPVRNPELVDVLLKVQDAEDTLNAKEQDSEEKDESDEKTQTKDKDQAKKRHQKSRKGVAAFDAILAALSDAEEVARKLSEAQKATGSTTATAPGSRDIHFLRDVIVYQLLSRRVQRDLTLVSALINSSQGPRRRKQGTSKDGKGKPGSRQTSKKANVEIRSNVEKEPARTLRDENKYRTDARVNPAIVKLLDTVVQSLDHMRSLSIVEESPDLASAVEARLAFTKSRRCVFLARSYAAVKQYAQALTLAQRSHLYLREASSLHSSADPASYYPLTTDDISSLEQLLQADEDRLKRDWFAYNGGSVSQERDASKKPLFFDIALNYVQLDMDRLQIRAGLVSDEKMKAKERTRETKRRKEEAKVVPTPVTPASKAKKEEVERPATPEPSAPSRGAGLSSLLGGWWGRK